MYVVVGNILKLFLLMSFVEYSFIENHVLTDKEICIFCFMIILGVLIFIHSLLLHKFEYSKPRICTDIAALATIVNGALGLACSGTSCNSDNQVFLLNIVGNVIFVTIFHASYIFLGFDRYKEICWRGNKIPLAYQLSVVFYALFLILLCRIVPYVVFPFFINLNKDSQSVRFQAVFNIVIPNLIYAVSLFLFQVYFSSLVILELVRLVKLINDVNLPYDSILIRMAVKTTIFQAMSIFTFLLRMKLIIGPMYGTVIISFHNCICWLIYRLYEILICAKYFHSNYKQTSN